MEDLQKSLRDQYSNDNEAYKAALAQNNITPGNSTGKVRGIQQAYYDGTIDKGTRDYMMADTIAKFARNTGRDIGNIGAQFTGGTVNNNFETSNWDKRNEELFKQQTSAEAAGIENSDKGREATGQNLANEKSDKALVAARLMEEYKNKALKEAERLRAEGKKAEAAIWETVAGEYGLLTSASTGDTGTEEHIGNVAGSLIGAAANGDITKEDAIKGINTATAGFGGAVGASLGALKPDIDINIDNPFAKEKTGNEALDAKTENDRNPGGLDTGVTNDIRDVVNDFNKMDPKEQGKLLRELYQGMGGNASNLKLTALVVNNQIDPNKEYGPYKGSDIIKRVDKLLKNEKFADEFKNKYTNMDPASSETLTQHRQQVAHNEAAEAASKLGMDVDNLSEEQKLQLVEMSKDSFGFKDDRARKVLDYHNIPY